MYPGSRSIIVRDSLPTLKTNTFPTAEKAIPASFISKFNQSNYIWTFKNRSNMRFFAEQDATDPERKRWNGLEFNFALLDQVEELNEKTFTKCLERMGSYFIPKHLGPQPNPVIILTENPNKEWSRKLGYDRWKAGTLPDDWLYIPARIYDNPHLEKSFIESLQVLKAHDPIKYQRFVDGDYDIEDENPDRYLHKFVFSGPGAHVRPTKFDPRLPLYLSFDFNKKNSCLVGQVDGDEKQAWILEEIQQGGIGLDLQKICEYLYERYGQYEPFLFVTGDASGNAENALTADNLSAYQLIDRYLTNAGFDMINMANVPNANMKTMASGIVSNSILQHNDIAVPAECTILLADISKVKRKSDGSLDKKEAEKGDFGHMLDCFRYFLTFFLYDWRLPEQKQD